MTGTIDEAYGREMDFGVLGRVEHWQDGAPVGLGGPKQRAVLAILLRDVGSVVSAETLITDVWGDDASTSLKASLHTYISNLRVCLNHDIERIGGGYRLEVAPSAVDAQVFIDMSDRAHSIVNSDPAVASDLIRRALAMWRGRPYDDLLDVPGLGGEIRRLEDLRLAAVQDRIDADLALGRHAQVVGELETLVTQHPFREGLRARHMLALYRNGRQAEALGAYQRTRERLIEELGVDPSLDLQRLEQQILEHDPSLLNDRAMQTDDVALLFTDIVGSTGLWESQPRLMGESLEVHDEIVRLQIDQAGGRIFKHTGDGVLAAFQSVSNAASAASAIQHQMIARTWGDIGPLALRTAIDAGEVEVRGGDYFGAPMNRNSRLLSAAHGGQVLLSQSAADALRNNAGTQIRSLGEYRFKGLGMPQLVFQLLVDGIPNEFPEIIVDRSSSDYSRQFGDVVRGYELRERVAESETSVVYRAYQPAVGRQVAVKVIRPEIANHPRFVRRFEPAARAAVKLNHPHIAPLLDFWRDRDGAYLVMPFLSGNGLNDPRYGAMTPERSIEIVSELASALSYAHRQGVIHQNVEPGNVLFDDDANVYVTDFGLTSKLITDTSGSSQITSPYRPPESKGGAEVDGRGDVYGLAGLAARLFTGSDPTDSALAALPDDVRQPIEQAMSAVPDNRHETVDSFASSLAECIGGHAAEQSSRLIRNPYKGLAAFDETESQDFFGREAEVDELVRLTRRGRMITVVGPSGSGKSSLVRAGLVPAVSSVGSGEPDGWVTITMVPGAHPFDELATALSGIDTESMGDLAAELRSDNHGLLRISKRLTADLGTELLVVLDQFEELYSLVHDDRSREDFIESLLAATEDPHSRLRVVLTVRADFFDRPLLHERLGPVVSSSLMALALPSRDQLLAAVEGPADAVDLRLEAGLAERVVDDVSGEPGGLPLMQFVLTELAAQSESGSATWATYRELGGVTGAVSRRAHAVYDGLDESRRLAAKQIFLRLVTVSDELSDVRRRVRRSELETIGLDLGTVHQVLDAFGSARLLTFDRDAVTREPTVEVAHEALLREWSDFTEWLADAREPLTLRRRFEQMKEEWESSGRSDDQLPTGGRLAQIEDLATDPALAMTSAERDFLAAAIAYRSMQETRTRVRRRFVVATLATAAVVAAVFAGVAWVQGNLASARQLIAEAEINLEVDPELSTLLALEAIERFDRFGGVPARATDVLRSALDLNRIVGRLPHGASVTASADGSVLVTAEDLGDRTATVWDTTTFEPLFQLEPIGDTTVNYVYPRVTANEMYISVLHDDGLREVWSWTVGASSLGERLSSPGYRPSASNLWFDVSPDASLVAEGASGSLSVRDRASGEEVYATSYATVSAFQFITGNRLAYLAESDGVDELVIVDVYNPSESARIDISDISDISIVDPNGFQFVAVLPDETTVAIASQTEVAVLDLASGAIRWQRDDLGRTAFPTWLPDGDLLVGGEGLAVILDGTNGERRSTLPGHRGGTFEYSMIPGTSLVATAALGGGETIIHDLEKRSPAIKLAAPIAIDEPWGVVRVDDEDRAAVHDFNDLAWVDPIRDDQVFFGGSRAAFPERTWEFPTTSRNLAFLAYVEDGQSKLWSTDEESMVYRAPDGFSIRGVADDGSLAVISRDSKTLVVRIPGGESVAQLDAGFEVQFATFVGDGRHLITSSGNRNVFNVWDRSTFERVAGFGTDGYGGWMSSLTPDGERMVVAGFKGSILIYDFAAILRGASDADAFISEIDAHNSFITGIDISADGTSVVSTAWDEPAKVWNLETRELQASFGHSGPAVGFHPSQQWLYVAENGVLQVHNLNTSDLLEAAVANTQRQLTGPECETYLRRSCDT